MKIVTAHVIGITMYQATEIAIAGSIGIAIYQAMKKVIAQVIEIVIHGNALDKHGTFRTYLRSF